MSAPYGPYLMSWIFCTPSEREQRRRDCPKFNGEHRGPQGPNEDMAQCGYCGVPTYSKRPPGETYGNHLDDCSLPIDHESYCEPGGSGHPPAERIRG